MVRNYKTLEFDTGTLSSRVSTSAILPTRLPV